MSVILYGTESIAMLADGLIKVYFNKNNTYGLNLNKKSRKIIFNECKKFDIKKRGNHITHTNLCIALHKMNLKAYNTRYKKSIKESPKDYFYGEFLPEEFSNTKFKSFFKEYENENNDYNLKIGYYKLLKFLNHYLYQIGGEIFEPAFYRTLDKIRNDLFIFIFNSNNIMKISEMNNKSLSILDIKSIANALHKIITLGFNYCQMKLPINAQKTILYECNKYDNDIAPEKIIFLILYKMLYLEQNKSDTEILLEYKYASSENLINLHEYYNYHAVVIEKDYLLANLLIFYLYKVNPLSYKNYKLFKAIKDFKDVVIQFIVYNNDIYWSITNTL